MKVQSKSLAVEF